MAPATSEPMGMATAISIDQRKAPDSCRCDVDPELAVKFISTKTNNLAQSARLQEIFLDYTGLLVSTGDVCFVLDERFDSFLNETDRKFKRSIQALVDNSDQSVRSTLAYQRLNEFLRCNLGYDGLDQRARGRLERINRREAIVDDNETPLLEDWSSKRGDDTSSGHVFCVNGSVCDLACDAFLCPVAIPKDVTNDRLTGRIFGRWRRHQRETYPEFWSCLDCDEEGFPPLKRYKDYPYAATLAGWPWKAFCDGSLPATLPFVVAGHVGFSFNPSKAPPRDLHVDQLVATLRDALDVILLELRANQPQPQHCRERYLITVPVLGTGGGGASDLTGQVVEKTLSVLNEYAIQQAIDCVLVCADSATFAHAQQIRYQIRRRFSGFSMINQVLHKEAKRLANLATSKHLSLFLGAGVSVGSGLPTWFQILGLLEDMFTKNGLAEERSLGDKYSWDPLKIADALESMAESGPDRHGVNISLKTRVQILLLERSRNPGLLLYLLLSLSTSSIVTQNYDQLIERALACRNLADSAQSASNLSVIPYSPCRGASCWLLKMHGCVSNPGDIVLTGSDYRAYEEGRLRALSGLVQANLMTSHLLFCGFSMTDPNYLRILKEVRHALNPEFQ